MTSRTVIDHPGPAGAIAQAGIRKEEGRTEAELYPAFLKLDGRRCLVVGGGPVAFQKVRELLRCGARVLAVSLEWSAEFASIGEDAGLTRQTRPFAASDLDGVLLVVAATDDRALQLEIADIAEQRSLLCNIVDVPDLCGYYVPASLRRGALTVSVSTNGWSPLFAVALRDRLAEQLGPQIGEALEHLREARTIVRALYPDDQTLRRRALSRLLAAPALDQLLDGRLDLFEERWRSWKSSLSA
jgi:precorrin-2 dehydrogenase/sirohydrochlorin ferrochelatase